MSIHPPHTLGVCWGFLSTAKDNVSMSLLEAVTPIRLVYSERNFLSLPQHSSAATVFCWEASRGVNSGFLGRKLASELTFGS